MRPAYPIRILQPGEKTEKGDLVFTHEYEFVPAETFQGGEFVGEKVTNGIFFRACPPAGNSAEKILAKKLVGNVRHLKQLQSSYQHAQKAMRELDNFCEKHKIFQELHVRQLKVYFRV